MQGRIDFSINNTSPTPKPRRNSKAEWASSKKKCDEYSHNNKTPKLPEAICFRLDLLLVKMTEEDLVDENVRDENADERGDPL